MPLSGKTEKGKSKEKEKEQAAGQPSHQSHPSHASSSSATGAQKPVGKVAADKQQSGTNIAGQKPPVLKTPPSSANVSRPTSSHSSGSAKSVGQQSAGKLPDLSKLHIHHGPSGGYHGSGSAKEHLDPSRSASSASASSGSSSRSLQSRSWYYYLHPKELPVKDMFRSIEKELKKKALKESAAAKKGEKIRVEKVWAPYKSLSIFPYPYQLPLSGCRPITSYANTPTDQLVGEINTNPNFEVSYDRLEWTLLKSLPRAKRNNLVVKRANCFSICFAFPTVFAPPLSEALWCAMDDARDDPNCHSMIKPKTAIPFPYEEANKMFPFIQDEIHTSDAIITFRQHQNPTVDGLVSVFNTNFKNYKEKSILYKEIVKLAHVTFAKAPNIKKIVAFGGGYLSTPAAPESVWTVRYHVQHATLLVFREVWESLNKDKSKKLPIYLSDPQYLPIDVEVAKRYDMTVVNCSPGHQKAWTLLDENTFIVDLKTCFPLLTVAFEFCRPAAFYAVARLTPEYAHKFDFKDDPYTITLKRDGKELVVPGAGPIGLVDKLSFYDQYEEHKLNMENFEFSTEPASGPLDEVPGRDGAGGHCYVGFDPWVYTRRSAAEVARK